MTFFVRLFGASSAATLAPSKFKYVNSAGVESLFSFNCLSHAAEKVTLFKIPARLFIEGLSPGRLPYSGLFWQILFGEPESKYLEVAFGGDRSCVAEVTFQAASGWVFGRSFE